MVAQATRMDITRLELMTQRIHWQQRCIPSLVTEVILELTTSQFRTTVRLSSDKLRLLTLQDVMTHKGEGDTTEVTATTETSNHHVRILPSHRHLLLSLQTDD